MTVLPIRITGDPVLHSRALPVTVFDDDLRALVADMVDTMRRAPGVGIAAPQVGVPLRIFVYEWIEDDGTEHFGAAINPTLWIEPLPIGEPDDEADSEGCLSVPGERFPLLRSQRAILKAFDEFGEPHEVVADGWLARIFQHEYDHLEGVLYVDRLEHPHDAAATKAIRKLGWGVPDQSWTPGLDHLEG
ncbi:MAG TPA: peptide deformylase [Terrimesophilobacter sp.]|nr:peptide deformylase [Terrimesophilobacter sp.]